MVKLGNRLPAHGSVMGSPSVVLFFPSCVSIRKAAFAAAINSTQVEKPLLIATLFGGRLMAHGAIRCAFAPIAKVNLS